MKRQFIVLLFSGAAFVSGCQVDPSTDPQPDNAKKFVSKITHTEDGVNTVYTLTYDAQNRITGYKDQDNIEAFNLSYDTKGNLSKIESKEDESKSIFEITYNAAGEPENGIYKLYDDDQLTATFQLTYAVSDGRVNEIVMKDPAGQNVYGKFILSYNNGNLTKVETSTLGQANISTTYTYGTKKNFFAGSKIKYVVDPGFSVLFYSANEILTEKIVWGQFITDVTNQYTYDADGYPTNGTIKTKSSFSDDEGTIALKIEYRQ
ncbi:MAG TPA: hypothetical protein VGE26_03765 [Sphingobacteriaceae bacterium]